MPRFASGRILSILFAASLVARSAAGQSAALISVVSADATTERVHIVWRVNSDVPVAGTVYRRTGNGSWGAQQAVLSGADHQIVYEDRNITPGTTYSYRVRAMDGDKMRDFGQVTVTVPTSGDPPPPGNPPPGNPPPGDPPTVPPGVMRVRPNPASTTFVISFTLTGSGPVRLDLLDVTGRHITSRNLGSMGAGGHTAQLNEAAHLQPGVYIVRLSQGGRVVWGRANVFH
jgi:hypothetical protein